MPVKLLEFKQKPMSFKKTLEEDIWLGLTPDLPLLRFEDRHEVLLFDELTTTKNISSTLQVKPMEDFRIIHYRAYTEMKLLPFYNKNGRAWKYHVPQSSTWTNSLPNLGKGEPLPLRGQVFSVSLSMLQALDNYYSNSVVHQRVKVPVITSGKEKKSVWLYVLPFSSFTKYLPHENRYELIKGYEPNAMVKNQVEGCYQASYIN